MKYVDQAVVKVYAGNGGAGSTHMKREKFLPKGGPDGGNGGKGGNVILKACSSVNTLIDFSYKNYIKAKPGNPGEENLKDGASGADAIKEVPIGTQVYFEDRLIADLDSEGSLWLAARGGRGGKGNAHFKSARNQAPDFAQLGELGEAFQFKLELKTVADVGLVGLPNAGKSSLISVLSEAKPEIANYPFTTKEPNLGVVRYGLEQRFVVADIPGLIPDAHLGKGLGIKFLKHIERTKVIAHLVDAFSLEEVEQEELEERVFQDILQIEKELREFSQALIDKPRIIVFTKSDLKQVKQVYANLKDKINNKGLSCILVSSANSSGLEELKRNLMELLSESK